MLSRLTFPSPRWYTGAKGSSLGSTGTRRLLRDPGVSDGSHVSTTWRPSVPRTYREFSLMVRDGTWPPIPVLLPPRLGPFSSASCCRRLRSQKNRMAPMIPARATRPILRPTVPPVPSLFELLFDVTVADEPGGLVGTTVTVLTTPVTVWRDSIGVGVHVEELGWEIEVCNS